MNIFDIRDAISKAQIDKLAENVIEFGIDNASHGSDKQGIVHMVGPETGRTQTSKVSLLFVGIVTQLPTVPLEL